ncbi:MAG: hypothetical protein MJ113_04075 [Lachnospiraceae bacterium]|nr:hypothetical protein [Lachnospiraceae bacterium]
MKLNLKEAITLALLGALMFCSKLLTESIPNVHFLAMFIIAYTVVFRFKALYAIFTFIMLVGLFYGFGIWWIPYFYLWPILWGVTMLLPKKMPTISIGKISFNLAFPVYMIVAGLHGLCYGTLYAPFQALVYGFDFQKTIAWIIAGLPWDVTHCIGNICASTLTLPVISGLKRAMKAANIGQP